MWIRPCVLHWLIEENEVEIEVVIEKMVTEVIVEIEVILVKVIEEENQ